MDVVDGVDCHHQSCRRTRLLADHPLASPVWLITVDTTAAADATLGCQNRRSRPCKSYSIAIIPESGIFATALPYYIADAVDDAT